MENVPPEWVFRRVSDRPGAVWLDAGDVGRGWTILAWEPEDVVEGAVDWVRAGRRLTAAGPRRPRTDLPFDGGCIGYVGYGAGWVVEPVPRPPPTEEPEVWLAHYPGALCYRHADRSWHPVGPARFVSAAQQVLAEATAPDPPPPAPRAAWRTTPRARFEDRVRTIQALLAAGDCYQVNLTRPVWVEGVDDPLDVYRRLRSASSAEYGAFLNLGSGPRVLSNSPELLLAVDGDVVVSEPVKGTRPRDADPGRDQRLVQALVASPKDRAELTMIVDLVRNDLGRVSVAGGVSTEPVRVTSHAHVHHASRRVRGHLRAGLDAWDALAAVFPPGSVTGAPKIRACQRIAELEDAPRGVYCGAVGYASASGSARWSVAIRSGVAGSGRGRFHVGGGVVLGSDPALEWEETVHKGRALATAFGLEPWE